jgi:hypothetical protein
MDESLCSRDDCNFDDEVVPDDRPGPPPPRQVDDRDI